MHSLCRAEPDEERNGVGEARVIRSISHSYDDAQLPGPGRRRSRRSIVADALGSTAPRSSAAPCTATSSCCRANSTPCGGSNSRRANSNGRSRRSPTGARPRTGRIGSMRRGEIWFAPTPSGDRPVLVLTRDPVANRVGSVVVAALRRTRRGLVSELILTAKDDGVPSDCVVNFDDLHTLPRSTFRRPVTQLSMQRMKQACRTLRDATGC